MKKFRIRLYPKYDLELAWRLRKERFESCDEYRTCMRCGGQMRPRLAENALSRAMEIRKRTPPGRFSTLQVPPWASTAARTIVRPKPVPPSVRLRALSTR